MRLSVVVPIYNEEATVRELITRVRDVPLEKEIVAVDDCSTDGTRGILEDLKGPDLRLLHHERNKGKGAAIRTGLSHVTGDMVIIQDADLEYFPEDYPLLIKPLAEGEADVVYGSRFLGHAESFTIRQRVANRFFTALFNLLFGTRLTDLETCYKLMRRDLLEGIEIECEGFDFEPEITAKLLKKGARIKEVPIRYVGREYAEGKKVNWRDAVAALVAILRFRFSN